MATDSQMVRVSIGTLGVLGLELVLMDTAPRTAYLQIYSEDRCRANCRFCSQARDSVGDLTRIARGIYLPFDRAVVVDRIREAYMQGIIRRVCIQTIMTPSMWKDATTLVTEIRRASHIPISFSTHPLGRRRYRSLKRRGVERLIIPLDTCTEELFDKIKGKGAGSPHRWRRHLSGLADAIQVFGRGKVGTHLIIGLGESDMDAIRQIDRLWRDGIVTALFAYTSINGSRIRGRYSDPSHYRRVQLAHYLISRGIGRYDEMRFEDGRVIEYGIDREVLDRMVRDGGAFQTTGCPACNRPYATETPRSMRNFHRRPTTSEIKRIREELGMP
ncbi:Radical SAM superfamily protein [Candidatus Methanoperedenaceae archaeon GB50]|nr:MAG: Radical SAM superfamily protein [Candidatus Methanoperedenaceae archaeon GB50]CAD7775671.1 Radical SAM superfamily protein [Candidatus Methanoperedenaceae archaeon GB37]CAD7775795.1 Radical SAM superfamily protein [Candidatus Methanoperedenaceae archaeon GB50]